MATLHDSLEALSPISWSDVPIHDLKPFATAILQISEHLCNIVPPAVQSTDASATAQSSSDNATGSHDVVISNQRHESQDADVLSHRKAWGKPLKIAVEENPVGFALYKMAGNDRHGAWFARHVVLENISFARMRDAMKAEFDASLQVQGGPGAGAVRGLGADERLERYGIDGLGQLEVLQFSAQFPGPTTPREFITLLLTSGLGHDESSGAKTHIVVSKPVLHPDAQERSGYIRGQYESVEMIREVRPSASEGSSGSTDEQVMPVEWIMITRSDPGGSIPRFMVERGTPAAICADAVKFLDWACSRDSYEANDAPTTKAAAGAQVSASDLPMGSDVRAQPPKVAAGRPKGVPRDRAPESIDVADHLTNALEAGIEQYAPSLISSYARGYIQSMRSARETKAAAENDSDDDNQDVTSQSTSSYESADDYKDADSVTSGRVLSPEEQKLHDKLHRKQAHIDAKLQARRERESTDQSSIREKHDKEMQKAREKHDKEMMRLEAKREKELDKMRAKRDRQNQRDMLSRVSRERDEYRDQAQRLRHENEHLRQQIEDRRNERLI